MQMTFDWELILPVGVALAAIAAVSSGVGAPAERSVGPVRLLIFSAVIPHFCRLSLFIG